MSTPKRRYEVQIKISADDKNALESSLRAILFNIEAYKVENEEIDLVSGGWDSSYIVTARVDTTITGDIYRDKLLKDRHS